MNDAGEDAVIRVAIVDDHGIVREGLRGLLTRPGIQVVGTAVNGQEACRLRIATLETKRRVIVAQLTKGQRLDQPVTLSKLGELYPQRRQALFKLRDELRTVASTISNRNKVSSRLAGAVLGHLNTVVRLLAGAVERAGVYTKAGVPRVANRIGIMEAVG